MLNLKQSELDKLQVEFFNKLKGFSVKKTEKMLYKLMNEIREKSTIG